jgi:lactoylglutathione lyase
MPGTQLKYVIKFVADMEKAVKFYRDTLGLPLKSQSPGWSEFVTGETTLALHPASDILNAIDFCINNVTI